MIRSIAVVGTLLVAGAFAAAEAAAINIGYAIVVENPLDNRATLNLAMRTNDYPNPMYPVLTDVKITDAWAQLYKGANAFEAPLPWAATALNPLTSDYVYSLANGGSFALGQGVTRAVITFTVDQGGPWDVRDQADFTPTGTLQYTAELWNGGADLVGGTNSNYVNLAVPGDFAVSEIPEPASMLLAFPALAGVIVAARRRKRI